MCVMVFWGESLGERLVKLDQVQLDFLNKPKGKTKIMEIPDIRCGSVRPQLWAVVFRSHQIDKGATGHWRKRSSWLACVVSPSYCKDVSHWKFLSLFGGKGYDIYIYIYIYVWIHIYTPGAQMSLVFIRNWRRFHGLVRNNPSKSPAWGIGEIISHPKCFIPVVQLMFQWFAEIRRSDSV